MMESVIGGGGFCCIQNLNLVHGVVSSQSPSDLALAAMTEMAPCLAPSNEGRDLTVLSSNPGCAEGTGVFMGEGARGEGVGAE